MIFERQVNKQIFCSLKLTCLIWPNLWVFPSWSVFHALHAVMFPRVVFFVARVLLLNYTYSVHSPYIDLKQQHDASGRGKKLKTNVYAHKHRPLIHCTYFYPSHPYHPMMNWSRERTTQICDIHNTFTLHTHDVLYTHRTHTRSHAPLLDQRNKYGKLCLT